MRSVYMASTQRSASKPLTQNQSNFVYTRLTKFYVDKAPLPEAGQTFIRDAELKGFALRLTPGSKSFIVEKRVDGKVRRMTLGRYPELTVEQARKEAHKLLGQIATGSNPVAEKKRDELARTTLAQAFGDFVEARKNLKARTIYDYRRLMEVAFANWQTKSITAITKDMVAKRHTQLGEASGEAYANLSMRFLRSLLNFAIAQYETPEGEPLLRENSVARLTSTRAWYHVGRRQTVIKPHQLPAWYQAVMGLKREGTSPQSVAIADYLLCLLFTGLRRQEAAQLQWEQVDLAHRTLTIPDTKNSQPLTLPLSDFLVALFQERKEGATGRYVFPGSGRDGYLIEPRKQMTQVMITSGVKFTIHDLRRTFITVAESLDISAYALKRLVNHKMNNDVTAGYIISDVDRLRAPMQKVTDGLLEYCKKQLNFYHQMI